MSAEITAAPAAVEGEKPATTTNGAKEVEVGEKRKAEETAASDEKKLKTSDGTAAPPADKGKGTVTQEEAKAAEAEPDPEEDETEDLIIDGPRKRNKVNYADPSVWKASGMNPDDVDEDEEDEDANPESPAEDEEEGEEADDAEEEEDGDDDDEEK